MTQTRRSFLGEIGLALGGAMIPLELLSTTQELERRLSQPSSLSDDDFWSWVRAEYTVSPNVLNLNNGGVSPQPKPVQEAFARFNALSNEAPSYYMWRVLDQGREPLRQRLADLAGCDAEELAICRNATEALNTVIFGLDLKAGDEVVLSKQDYPNMINAWKQRAIRDGIVLRWVDLELPQEKDDYFVDKYTETFSDRTRVVHLTHLINWTGQVLPVRKIADKAKAHGILAIADIAHSFAQLDFRIPDLGCAFAGTSLHKWLGAPFGSGMLYIEKDSISMVWPLLGNDKPQSEDIRKFETLGTRSFPTEMAIGTALDFHLGIGSGRKYDRLSALRQHWVQEVEGFDRVKFNSPRKGNLTALANFSIDGLKPEEVDGKLWEKWKIHTVAINWENIHGVRVTPNVYHSFADLDRLVEGIDWICRNMPTGKG